MTKLVEFIAIYVQRYTDEMINKKCSIETAINTFAKCTDSCQRAQFTQADKH